MDAATRRHGAGAGQLPTRTLHGATVPWSVTRPTAIRFLGLRVASLASVSINTFFGSPHVDADERKLLAFTDSVQDASHRASFFAGRTHRFNLAVARWPASSQQVGSTSPSPTSATNCSTRTPRPTARPLRARAARPAARSDVCETIWTGRPNREGLEIVRQRLGFEVDLEFGLALPRRAAHSSCHVSPLRTVDLPDLDAVARSRRRGSDGEMGRRSTDESLDGSAGVRARPARTASPPRRHRSTRSSIRTWTTAADSGSSGEGARRPATVHPGPGSSALLHHRGHQGRLRLACGTISSTPTWAVDWATRMLGVEPAIARDAEPRHDGAARPRARAASSRATPRRTSRGGSHVERSGRDVPDSSTTANSPSHAVRCGLCGDRDTRSHRTIVDHWVGTTVPALPLHRHLPSRRSPRRPTTTATLYRQGTTRRVVAARAHRHPQPAGTRRPRGRVQGRAPHPTPPT